MTLSTIISKYEERVKEIVKGIDKDESDGGYWETSTGVEFGEDIKHALLASIPSFALELVIEAFEATAVKKMNTNLKDTMGRKLPNLNYKGFNKAIDIVEARQREFINEQQ